METMIVPRIRVANSFRTNLMIKLRMLLYSIYLLFRGDLKTKNFSRYLRRLLLFIGKMKGNKYVKLSRGTKINLYVPAFPSKAFFYATHKMLEFEKKMPSITALISITSACRYDCKHCYQKLDKGKDVDLKHLLHAVNYFQDNGVAFFNIEGGDPFLVYDRLKSICSTIDRRSEILINSTGDKITKERLEELKKTCNLSGIMFSLHTSDESKLNQFMNNDMAFANLINGIDACHQAGVPVMFNTCLSKDDYASGEFDRVMALARDLGGCLIQLIKPKGAGGWLLNGADHFSKSDLDQIKDQVIKYNTAKDYRYFPFIAAMIIDEDEHHFGCTAGGTDRFYLNAKGDLQACEFLNLSFGNIAEEPISTIYERMRSDFNNAGSNWLCEVYHKKVAENFKAAENASLPLPYEVTKQIMNTEEHGEAPDFYKRVNNI